MPELPEVETTVSGMKRLLPKLKILDVKTDTENLFKKTGFGKFRKQVKNKTILSVSRRGKNILIHLSENKTVLIHMKMTGHLMYGNWKTATLHKEDGARWIGETKGAISEDPFNRFIHVIFFLSNKKQLALSDTRKFAKILICETNELENLLDIKNLGIDPFGKKFLFKKFFEIIRNKKRKIKTILLDQTLIAGIGNIYADEILWEAGVHPAKNSSDLNADEIKKIYETIKPILKKAVKFGGSSNSDYRNMTGNRGRFQEIQNAYRQTDKPCNKNDGGIIKKITVGGRSSHFCSQHQKM